MADVRALLKAKRQEIRINHPLASYSSAGQLRCIACGIAIKQSTSWEGHIGSKTHRTNAARLREQQQRDVEKEELALKRKQREVELDDSETDAKKARTDEESYDEDAAEDIAIAPKVQNNEFPADFFSDPSKAPILHSNDSDDEGGEESATPAQAPSAIDLEWERFQREVVSAPDARETYERATIAAEPVLAMETPEGFPAMQTEITGVAEKTEREEAMDEEALRRKNAEEERELIMDRLMDEERAQEEADARVSVLKNKLENLRKQRELVRAQKQKIGRKA